MDKKTPGVRQTKDGWQIYAKVRGKFISKHFPPDTPMATLIAERKTLGAMAHLGLETKAAEDAVSLAADVKKYLKAKAGMPTIVDRTHRIEWWRDVLGRDRSRDSITSIEIRQHLAAKRKAGAKPGTLNVYRTALMDFFTVLNGSGGSNPAKEVPITHEEELPLDLPTLDEAVRAIAATAPHCRYTVRMAPEGSKTQARLMVLLWTGWPSATLMRVRPTDVHWETRTATVYGRLKGGGTKPRTVPLLPQAIEALQRFTKLKAWGKFSGSSLHSALHEGCDAAGVRRFRVYDLRHLFGTMIVSHSRDERGAAELMLHTQPQQTWRYTRHAASTRATATIAAVAEALPIPPQPGLVKPA